MKFSQFEAFEAALAVYHHYIDVISRIDTNTSEWNIEIVGMPFLHEYSDPSETDELASAARALAKRLLNETKAELESIGVEFDHSYGVPEDIYREWFGDEAWQKEAARRAEYKPTEDERLKLTGGS